MILRIMYLTLEVFQFPIESLETSDMVLVTLEAPPSTIGSWNVLVHFCDKANVATSNDNLYGCVRIICFLVPFFAYLDEKFNGYCCSKHSSEHSHKSIHFVARLFQ